MTLINNWNGFSNLKTLISSYLRIKYDLGNYDLFNENCILLEKVSKTLGKGKIINISGLKESIL